VNTRRANSARRVAAICLLAGIALIPVSMVNADRLSIGQIDTGRLLYGQRVDLFVSIDPAVDELSPEEFTIQESVDGVHFVDVPAVVSVTPVRSLNAPLSFYMLIDNSGSMYDETTGDGSGQSRIDAARAAIRDFANSITNQRDMIGLAAFNTRYRMIGSPSRDRARIGDLLEEIERPARAEGYTELYYSLIEAAVDASSAGRRTVVVLSDGENYPYSLYEGGPHPELGDRLFTYEEAIDAFQREGLSVFAIHYGDGEDPNLDTIANATGGRVYRAVGGDDLSQVYQEIRATLLDEFRISYRATMLPSERRIVRVRYTGGTDSLRLSADRPYFANTLFSVGESLDWLVLIIMFGVGALVLGTLLVVTIRAAGRTHSLVLLDSGGARGIQKTVALSQGDTIIGASPDADITIAGRPTVGDQHATVKYDRSASAYTIVSDAPVRVNNKLTTHRALKTGDVINIEGTVFAFEDATEEEEGSPPDESP
jgi:Ca-activated chloride channel family protein